jgi:hypothetical protein
LASKNPIALANAKRDLTTANRNGSHGKTPNDTEGKQYGRATYCWES